jgi:cell wall assembly regulator SMI1
MPSTEPGLPARLQADLDGIAQWVARNAPEGAPMFCGPASDQEIAATERQLGLALPASVQALYRLANGQPDDAARLLDAFGLMPLAQVADAAAFLNDFFPNGVNEEDPGHSMEVDTGIRPMWWNPGWIPLMTNGSGDYYCLDLDPADGGAPRQIVSYFHDETFRHCIAPNIETLLSDIASGLEDGSYVLDDLMISKRN